MTIDPTAWRLAVIRTSLQAAVLLRIAELAHLTEDERLRMVRGIDTHDLHADDATFGGTHAVEGMRNLVTALALLAYSEGGVNFNGLHFCTNHAHCLDPEGVPA